MRHLVKLLMPIALCAGVAIPASPAQAKVPGPNGQIVLGRFDPALGDTVSFTVNPDGSHEQQLFPGTSEVPRWSPDGTQVALLARCTDGEENCAVTIVDPDTGTFRQLKAPDPSLFTACPFWSSDGTRLACEGFGEPDPSRNGIYTIRSSDGGGLTQVTSNPGGDDIPGDYSPDGNQIAFARMDPTRPPGGNQAVFVVNVDGSGLRRITPWGLADSRRGSGGSWSPDGRRILFGAHGFLYVVHPDGTGLRPIRLDTGGSAYYAFQAGWSPDGSRIVFSMYPRKGGRDDIYTAKADGTDLVQVTNTPDFEEFVDWGAHPLAP